LSLGSHTPDVHTSAPAAVVQVPLSVGFACVGSLGTGWPFGNVGVHVCVPSSHQLPAAQSASTSQPPAGSHTPLVLQVPERHTVPPFPVVQGPSPFA
jgi:hypothetical protein